MHIPLKLRKEINIDPFYGYCSLKGQEGHQCEGRITLEHAIIYASKQLNAKWAIISLCERGHAVGRFQDAGTMNKEMNLWVALNRATNQELDAISKVISYVREKDRLNTKYGVYVSYYDSVRIKNSEHHHGGWICECCDTINQTGYGRMCKMCGIMRRIHHRVESEINY